MECRLLLDVVVAERATVLELLAGEDEPLLVRWNSFLVLDLLLDALDGVARHDTEHERLPGVNIDDDLHALRARRALACRVLVRRALARHALARCGGPAS